jgi:hypothetical protein
MALQAAGVRPIRAAISRHPNPFSTILISVSLSCLLQQYSLRFLGVCSVSITCSVRRPSKCGGICRLPHQLAVPSYSGDCAISLCHQARQDLSRRAAQRAIYYLRKRSGFGIDLNHLAALRPCDFANGISPAAGYTIADVPTTISIATHAWLWRVPQSRRDD